MTYDKTMELLDSLTPYYHLRIQRLSPAQRRILSAMARMNRPGRASEIAGEARMEPRATSMTLTRLKRAGHLLHKSGRWQLKDPWLAAYLRGRSRREVQPPESDPPKPPSLVEQLVLADQLVLEDKYTVGTSI